MSDVQTYDYHVGGEWKKAAGGATFEVLEPYSRKPMHRVAACGADETREAIEAAHQAFPAWAALPPAEKAALFFKAANIVRSRMNEIADLLSRETGSTISFSAFQQHLVIQSLEAAAAWVYQPSGQTFPSNVPGRHSFSIRRPLGVVASFTPWNGANILSWRAVLAPIAAGNTVVVKPSELAPVSAGLIVAKIAEEAGFPAGVINVVPHAAGGAGVIADAIFASPHVRCINLIGGVKTARILAERAGKTLKRSVLELGGYNPLIVLDDVDVDYAVRSAVFGAFFHQGQICMNTRKVIIQRKIHDEFLAKFIQRAKQLPSGDPSNPETLDRAAGDPGRGGEGPSLGPGGGLARRAHRDRRHLSRGRSTSRPSSPMSPMRRPSPTRRRSVPSSSSSRSTASRMPSPPPTASSTASSSRS